MNPPLGIGGPRLTRHDTVGGVAFLVTDHGGKVLVAASVATGEPAGLLVLLLTEYIERRAEMAPEFQPIALVK